MRIPYSPQLRKDLDTREDAPMRNYLDDMMDEKVFERVALLESTPQYGKPRPLSYLLTNLSLHRHLPLS